MEAQRGRLDAIVEWGVAVACIAAALAAGSAIAREFRTIAAVTPVIAGEAVTDIPVPAGIPPRAVSVPMLLLPDVGAIKLLESLSAIDRRIGRLAAMAQELVERAPNGERRTRFYEYGGTRFLLVFEPFQRDAEPQVAAIYLQ